MGDNECKVEVPLIDAIDRMPEKSFDLEEVKKCILYDIDRKPISFADLVNNKSSWTIFVFIRHFLDYVTREYVEDFSKIFPYTLEEREAKIVLIGCAPARFIRQFVEDTSCPHEIYCDSGRTIHNCLGFHTIPVDTPIARSPHIKSNSFVGFWQTVWRVMKSQTEQGSPFQMGGQLIMNNREEILFFHRDRHPLDHTPINELLSVIDLPRIDFCTKYKIKHV